MKTRRLSLRTSLLALGASSIGLVAAACNRQPNATEAAMVAPPAAALPLAAGAPPSEAPAPVGAAAAPAAAPIRYAPAPPQEGYGCLDQAASMSQAFADTPPDYAVDYQGTRPWIWRSGSGAYRIVERLPRGERFFYYRPGQAYPFLVRDPDYSYAYDGGRLVAVYGPGGTALNDALAEQRAAEASRYLYRARELYQAAQSDRREAAYAAAWAERQDEIRRENLMWQQQQAQNAQWNAWHRAHQAEEQRQWRQERDQRLAYAAAIGLAAASRGAAPSPAQVARRQEAYLTRWNEAHAPGPATPRTAASPTQVAAVRTGAPQNQPTQVRQREVAAARASSIQAIRAERLATQAHQRAAAAAQARAVQAAQAQKLTAQARQHQAAAAQARQREAVAARAAAVQTARSKQLAAQAKRQGHATAAAAKKAKGETKRRPKEQSPAGLE